MEKELKLIFSDFEVNNKKIPFAHLKYSGKEKTYIVWTITREDPIFSSDDEITYSEVEVDIDIYSDSNYLNILNSVKNKMKENEWTWVGDSLEDYEEETKLYHKTSTFIKERSL